jgi:hypothetical protein
VPRNIRVNQKMKHFDAFENDEEQTINGRYIVAI